MGGVITQTKQYARLQNRYKSCEKKEPGAKVDIKIPVSLWQSADQLDHYK